MPFPHSPAVLIVEDEILIRMLAAEAFVEAGFVVFKAEHAAHALILLEDGVLAHLLFTDVNMPGEMDGIALAERLKGDAPEMHVMIASALPLHRPVDHLSATFVSKPYDPKIVCDTARQLFLS